MLFYSSGRTWMMRVVGIVMIAVCGYLIFEFGRIRADYNIVEAVAEGQRHASQVDELEDKIVDLKQEIALVQTHRNIDREAYKVVEERLTALQVTIQEQRDALAFYRGIVSPEDGNSGLRVQNLRLTRGQAEREYNLRVVLVQSMQHDRKVSGDVRLSIEGSQDGVATSYSYSQLLPESTEGSWNYSFRYFQDFDRSLVLPDGFTPEKIKIEVNSKTRSIASVEQSFSWAKSLG